MTMDIETFDSLWACCTANERLVPLPSEWAALHGMLANTRRKPSGGWGPPLPLILTAWDCTMPIEKQLRFREHIQWANRKEKTWHLHCHILADLAMSAGDIVLVPDG